MSTNVDWVIQKAYTFAVRKSVPPQSGTPKYNVLISIIDSKQKEWANEPGVDWDSLYERRTLSATPNGTDTITLDSDINHVITDENDPIIIAGDEFRLVSPSQLYRYRNSHVCAEVNGVLKFPVALDAKYTGQNVIVPIVREVKDLTQGNSLVEVDEPMWLAAASAAEFVRNDVVKAQNYNLILQMAQQYMDKMLENNGGSVEEVDLPWTPEGMVW